MHTSNPLLLARPCSPCRWTHAGGYEYFKRTTMNAMRNSGEAGAEAARRLQLPIMIGSAACAETIASAALCPLEVST